MTKSKGEEKRPALLRQAKIKPESKHQKQESDLSNAKKNNKKKQKPKKNTSQLNRLSLEDQKMDDSEESKNKKADSMLESMNENIMDLEEINHETVTESSEKAYAELVSKRKNAGDDSIDFTGEGMQLATVEYGTVTDYDEQQNNNNQGLGIATGSKVTCQESAKRPKISHEEKNLSTKPSHRASINEIIPQSNSNHKESKAFQSKLESSSDRDILGDMIKNIISIKPPDQTTALIDTESVLSNECNDIRSDLAKHAECFRVIHSEMSKLARDQAKFHRFLRETISESKNKNLSNSSSGSQSAPAGHTRFNTNVPNPSKPAMKDLPPLNSDVSGSRVQVAGDIKPKQLGVEMEEKEITDLQVISVGTFISMLEKGKHEVDISPEGQSILRNQGMLSYLARYSLLVLYRPDLISDKITSKFKKYREVFYKYKNDPDKKEICNSLDEAGLEIYESDLESDDEDDE